MRYERKYRIENVDINLIKQVIRMHPAGLRTIYPDRQINNIYFDTPDLTTYKENVVGIATRKKYRVRWYAWDPLNVIQPQFEIKYRDNEIGTKDIFPISKFNFNNLDLLINEVNELSKTFAQLLPTLQNSYKRAYWGSLDGKFRITLDWDLSYASMSTSLAFTGHQQFEKNIAILELKYDKEHELEADRISQYFPFRRTKNSKYVNGVDLCF